MEFLGAGGAVAAVAAGLAVSSVWGANFKYAILGALLAWGGVFLLLRGIAADSATAILFAIALGPVSLLTFWIAFKEHD